MGEQKAKTEKRGQETHLVDPSLLKVDKSFNARLSYDGEDFDQLKASIKENGVQDPLKVKRDEEGNYQVLDGHRRSLAVQALLKEGVEVGFVPVIKARKTENEEDAILDLIIQNDGKPLNLIEEGIVFRRLEKKGYSVQEIAQKTGRTAVKVRNGILAASAPKKVHDYVGQGKIASTTVMQLMQEMGDKASDEEIVAKVESALEKVEKESEKSEEKEASGESKGKGKPKKKKKVTAKDVTSKGNPAPLATLRKVEEEAKEKEGLDEERVKLLSELREALETGKTNEEILKLFDKKKKLGMKTVKSKKKGSKASSGKKKGETPEKGKKKDEKEYFDPDKEAKKGEGVGLI